MSFISKCPRCGSRSFEKLQTYSHCFECLFIVDWWDDMTANHLQEIRQAEALLSTSGGRKAAPVTLIFQKRPDEAPSNDVA